MFVIFIVIGLLITSFAWESSFFVTSTNRPHPPYDSVKSCERLPWWHKEEYKNKICCGPQHFLVDNMASCHPWLTCSDFEQIILKELIGYGAVKAVYRAEWNGVEIAVSVLNNVEYFNDFSHGVKMLKLLNPSPFVVQLVGHCEDLNVVLTEYHKLGNAVYLTNIIYFVSYDNPLLRLGLCLNYAQILNYLHNSPAGKRVLCDSNNLIKLLSQLLIKDDLTLVINDVDALPEVSQENNFTIKCGHQKISGSFVAPEQLWPFGDDDFDDGKMPGYDEKTDIWKAVNVCEHFIGGSDVARYHLFSLHKKCKSHDASKRPSAETLVNEYIKIIKEIGTGY